jgi:hypothetical protein
VRAEVVTSDTGSTILLEQMPRFGIFDANVLVDDVELPEYDVLTDNTTNTVTCWIPCEAGKVCCSYMWL